MTFFRNIFVYQLKQKTFFVCKNIYTLILTVCQCLSVLKPNCFRKQSSSSSFLLTYDINTGPKQERSKYSTGWFHVLNCRTSQFPSPFLIPMSAWREFHSFSCVASTLRVSPSLVSRYCEGYSFLKATGP